MTHCGVSVMAVTRSLVGVAGHNVLQDVRLITSYVSERLFANKRKQTLINSLVHFCLITCNTGYFNHVTC